MSRGANSREIFSDDESENPLERFSHSSLSGSDNCVYPMSRRGFLIRATAACFLGAILGIVTSLVVNIALVEISLSRFFAVYFGVLFIIAGGVIAWRITSRGTSDPDDRYQVWLLILASVVVLSGFLCIILPQDWSRSLPRGLKFPIYITMGTSVAFTTTFTIVDVLNILFGVFQFSAAKPLVQSLAQVRLVVALAVAMGAVFGAIFSWMDTTSAPHYIKLALAREENTCLPIGALFGALGGLANEALASRQTGWEKLQQAEYNEDI